MIRPGYSGSSYFSGERSGVKFGWDFFFGTQARAVAWNIFLDSNTFQNSRSVVKEPACSPSLDHDIRLVSAAFKISIQIREKLASHLSVFGADLADNISQGVLI
jgi:hypothetical protein